MLSDERRKVSDGKTNNLTLKSPRLCQEKTPDPFSVPPTPFLFPFESYGPVIEDYRILPIAQPHWEQTILVGEIVYVDRFGNLISNLTPAQLEEVHSITKRRQPFFRIGKRIIEGLVNSYGEGMAEKPSALINSDGKLEIFLKEASAADLLQMGRGERIEVS